MLAHAQTVYTRPFLLPSQTGLGMRLTPSLTDSLPQGVELQYVECDVEDGFIAAHRHRYMLYITEGSIYVLSCG